MDIGARIKSRRLELGMSLDDLGKRIGVNRSTIKRYEDGLIKNIPQKTVEMLAVALKTTPSYLMGWDSEKKQDDLQLDGEILLLAREMQKLPADKRNLLKNIIKTMSNIASGESEK